MRSIILTIIIFFCTIAYVFAQDNLGNIPGRKLISLNGKWNAIIDPFDAGIGSWFSIWKDKKPSGKTDFYEYSFDLSPTLNVPGDFNSQLPDLRYFEGAVWYKKKFIYKKDNNKRLFIHFGSVNYKADVFLNNEQVGSHEGGFTPFMFEVTNLVKDGENSVIVRANNTRVKDGIPALGYDWWNYGGITRDVNLIETPETFIKDYFIQLQKGSRTQIQGWVKLKGSKLKQNLKIQIPEAKVEYKLTTDSNGFAPVYFPAKLTLWSPDKPKLYAVNIISETDTVNEYIGFRSIEVRGTDILLNGESIFLKGVNIHEEIPQRMGRAYSDADALMLLNWAKELGCNFVRLAHYPHNEYMVRNAERMGLMIWSELPVYQGIAFGDPLMQDKMNTMLQEMVQRDKNRCGIVIWSMSNETSPGRERNITLTEMAKLTRYMDPTRLVSSAFNRIRYENNTVFMDDTLSKVFDVIAVNEYLGWYKPWPSKPEEVVWTSPFNKPLIMSEFGGEALYGNHGPDDVASSWSEEFQEKLYTEQVAMLKTIPFLRGTCPWILVDFRSPGRMHPMYQNGWNRKGLISDQGYRKKAWYVMQKFYEGIK